MTSRLLCTQCVHYKTNGQVGIIKGEPFCKAFPDRIPYEILLGHILHYRPLKSQDNEVVFELPDRKLKHFNDLQLKIETLSQNKHKIELEVISLLSEIVDRTKIKKDDFKLVAFWLQYENSGNFFWKSYRELEIFVITQNNEIIELKVKISSDFIKKAYDLLWIENVQNHNSSMHIHLNEDETYKFYYSIEHRKSFMHRLSLKRDYIFLRTKKDHDKIELSEMYKGFKKIEKSEMLKAIDDFLKDEEELIFVRAYKIFLFFFIRNILITTFEAQLLLKDLRKTRK